MKIKDLLSGVVTLEEADSPINGKISVVKSLGYGTYLQVGNLTQSGGVVFGIWKNTLSKIKTHINEPQNILILGLGGGSCAKISRKLWPYSIITGVDFDKTIVELGVRYLDLGKDSAEIVVSDAFEFVEKAVGDKKIYDLITIDLFVGQEYPVVFEGDDFLVNVKSILSDSGIAVFNRLFFDEKRSQSMNFGEKLEKYFSKVEYFYPEANVMMICNK